MSLRHTSLMLIALVAADSALQAAAPDRCLQGGSEEVVRELGPLVPHCKKMLALQEEVLTTTVALQRSIASGVLPMKDVSHLLLALSKKQGAAIAETRKMIELLEKDGAAVAFPEVIRDLQGRMRLVQARLAKGELGSETQKSQEEVIDTLKEMLAALK